MTVIVSKDRSFHTSDTQPIHAPCKHNYVSCRESAQPEARRVGALRETYELPAFNAQKVHELFIVHLFSFPIRQVAAST